MDGAKAILGHFIFNRQINLTAILAEYIKIIPAPFSATLARRASTSSVPGMF